MCGIAGVFGLENFPDGEAQTVASKMVDAMSHREVNMLAISMESKDGIFEGNITALVMNTTHLKDLIGKLKNVNGVHTVERVDEER